MIKLLIADDEYIVIESVKFIIEKHVPNVEVVGTARSGREAIEKALSLKPDIILMDIHIPGINGIEAIRHIKASHCDAIFVIISAYEYFQYAKEAVKLGVQDYLLKPLNKNKLIKVIDEICQIIEARREAVKREMLLMEKINNILPHMEGQFILSQLFNDSCQKNLSFYEEIFGMDLSYGYVMMAVVEAPEAAVKAEGLKNSLLKQQFYELFTMRLKNASDCLVGLPHLDRIVAYIPIDSTMDAYEIKNNAIGLAKGIISKLNKSLQLPYQFGLGRAYPIEHFSKSYQEAHMAASIYHKDTVTHYEDVHLLPASLEDYPHQLEKIFLDRILIIDTKGALEAFSKIFQWLSRVYGDNCQKMKSKLLELFILTQRVVPYEVGEREPGERDYLLEILEINDIKDLNITYINYLRSLLARLEETKNCKLSGLILSALRYIEENYRDNIGLDDVAKQINMSYHHFSKFFKESTGKNFVDYLTELRVEKAKEILKDKTINIKEICYEVGYTDPNYFSKIFKKSTGMTPTEFRNYAISQER